MQAANEADIEVISNIRTQDSSPQVISTPKELRDALWSAVEANKDLKESEKEQLYHLLLAYKDTFAHNQADLGRTDRVQHEVRTDDAYPIRQRVRRTAPAQREETRKLIEEMLHKDIIQSMGLPCCLGAKKGWLCMLLCGLPPGEQCHQEGCLPPPKG